MRIALLSNVTVEVLAGMLGGEHRVWLPSGFGAWLQTALEPPQDLLDFKPDEFCLLLDGRFGSFDPAMRDQALAALAARFPGVPVVMPDLAALAADFGDGFYDERMWCLASMPFSLKGLRALRNLLALHKVLALDLDGTLWRGVIGEDGVDGIVLDSELSRQLRALRERGVLLALLSRNNPEDVEAAFAQGILDRADFVAMRIDWQDKAENLSRIAAELNLGTDAFVFVDDNPAERACMRAAHPEVAVTEFPPRLEDYFPRRALTAEDARRTEQYRQEAARRDFAVGLTVADYLAGLDLRAEIHPLREAEIPRVAQLAQKTNQFNVTTHRYTEDDLRRFMVAPDRTILAVHAGDRFGEQGLVAFVQVTRAGTAAHIVDFVMSCRVMNRTLEVAIEAELERTLRAQGVTMLTAEYVPTAKNVPVRDLFEALGFVRSPDGTFAKRLASEPTLTHHYRINASER